MTSIYIYVYIYWFIKHIYLWWPVTIQSPKTPKRSTLKMGPEPIGINGVMGPYKWPYKWVSEVIIVPIKWSYGALLTTVFWVHLGKTITLQINLLQYLEVKIYWSTCFAKDSLVGARLSTPIRWSKFIIVFPESQINSKKYSYVTVVWATNSACVHMWSQNVCADDPLTCLCSWISHVFLVQLRKDIFVGTLWPTPQEFVVDILDLACPKWDLAGNLNFSSLGRWKWSNLKHR